MRMAISVCLLVAAAILLFYGFEASDSFASHVERAVDGTPTDRSIWLLVAGAACGIIGLFGLVTRSPRLAN